MPQIQVRRGTTAQWTAANPILAAGEPGYDTTLEVFKIGNGTDRWLTLPVGEGMSEADADARYAPMGGAPSEKARVTFGGIPTMFHDFVGLTDGSAVPTTATSGQPIHWATGYGAVPYFANGSFLAIAPGAAYWCTEDMGENVTHVGGRFVFAPNGGTPGGTMCVAVTDQKMIPANISALNMSVHFWTTYENWAVTVWDSANGGQQVLVDGTYATPLVRDAMTMYDMQAWISGDRGTFILPTGERVYVNDSRFISLTGRFAFVESLLNAGTDDFPCILNATVSTGNTRAPARI